MKAVESKICVVIPTYNNASTLLDVINQVLKFSNNVIVVNDGSTDTTANLLEGCGNAVTVVSYSRNRGKGYALKQGFKRAEDLGYDYVITIDSDGQHYPDNIPLFIDAIAENPGSFIVGSRDLGINNVPDKNRFANKFSNFWFYLQTGIKLPDTQTGYRLYPLKRMSCYRYISNRYESELELLVFAAWHSVKIIPIPIKVFYPPEDQRVTHFRPTYDFVRISILNTFLCIGAVVYALPLRIFNYIKRG